MLIEWSWSAGLVLRTDVIKNFRDRIRIPVKTISKDSLVFILFLPQ